LAQVEDLNVQLPKFKIEQSMELSQTLSKLGLETLFDPAKSDLTHFIDSKQRDTVKVGEEVDKTQF
jgi:serine protease inhibitor